MLSDADRAKIIIKTIINEHPNIFQKKNFLQLPKNPCLANRIRQMIIWLLLKGSCIAVC